MTNVINLFGGPGSGKSTLAADLFAAMKKKGLNVELVTEYVKGWAWEGKIVGKFDQIYLLGKQTHLESRLYGKVDYIITDSPIMLCPFYEFHYYGIEIALPAAKEFLKVAKDTGIKHYNFWLPSMHKYDAKGRYQTAKEAEKLTLEMSQYLMTKAGLDFYGIPFDGNSVEYILKYVEGE